MAERLCRCSLLVRSDRAAGEAPVEEVTIFHVGRRWQALVLERYLLRYQVRPVIQYVVRPVVQPVVRPPAPAPAPARPDHLHRGRRRQHPRGGRPLLPLRRRPVPLEVQGEPSCPWRCGSSSAASGARSISREASGCIRFASQGRMCPYQYIRLTKLANLARAHAPRNRMTWSLTSSGFSRCKKWPAPSTTTSSEPGAMKSVTGPMMSSPMQPSAAPCR